MLFQAFPGLCMSLDEQDHLLVGNVCVVYMANLYKPWDVCWLVYLTGLVMLIDAVYEKQMLLRKYEPAQLFKLIYFI
jgi:hypothetical protein